MKRNVNISEGVLDKMLNNSYKIMATAACERSVDRQEAHYQQQWFGYQTLVFIMRR